MTTEKLEVQIVEDRGSTNKLIASVNGLASASDKLAGSTEKSTKATAQAGTQADRTAAQLGALQRSVGNISNGFGLLAGAFAGFVTGQGLSKIVEYADTFTNMSNKLRLVTTDQQQLNSILDASFKIARNTRTSYEEVTNTYGKVSTALKRYGGDAKDADAITKTIARSIQISGASSQDAAASLRQFGQTLESGQVQAEELNSIIEATPALARAIEAGLSKAGITVEGSLKKMAENGKLSVKQILDALKLIGPEIDTFGSGALPTVSQALQVLSDSFLKYIGQANQATGATGLLVKAIEFLADNIGVVVPNLVAFTGLLALGAAAGAINSIAGLVSGFRLLAPAITASTAAMAINPLFILATVAAIGAVAVGVALFGDKITALTAKLGPAALAALGLSTATAATATASNAAAPAVTAQAASVTALGASAATAAPLVAGVGTSAAKAATDLQTIGLNAGGAATGFTTVTTAGRGAATAFTEVGLKATTAGTGFTEVTQKANTLGTGFTVVTQKTGEANAKFVEQSTVLPQLRGGLTDASTSVATLATEYEHLFPIIDETTIAQAKQNEETRKSFDLNTLNTKAMEDSRKALTEISRTTDEAAKAAADYQKRLERLSGAFNQYGEKLETAEERTRRFAEAQKRSDDAIKASLDNLRQYYPQTERVASGVDGMTSSADRASAAFARLDGSIDSINDGSGFSNLARGLDSVTSAADRARSSMQAVNTTANGTNGDSVAQTIRKSAGDGSSSVNNDPKISGTFSKEIYYGVVSYNGTPIGAWVSRAVDSPITRANRFATSEALNDKVSSAKTTAEARAMLPYNVDFRPILGGVFAGNFAHGGSFTVGGNGGTDSQRVSFMATPNEQVTIETPAQRNKRLRGENATQPAPAPARQPVIINYTVKTNDIDEFRRNKRQANQDLVSRLSGRIR